MIETSIFIGDLRAHVGSRRDIHIEVPGDTFASPLAQVVDEITCDLTLESVSHGIVVHGTLATRYSAKCSYGLVDIVEPLTAVVNELFEEVKFKEQISHDAETYQFIGNELDIEQMLRDSVIPSLPLAPVCGHGPENCSICSSQIEPFISRDVGELSNQIIGGIDDVLADDKDPRWSVLDDLRFDETDE